MHVIVAEFGNVVVDDVRHPGDVDATAHDVRRHQDPGDPLAELLHRPVTSPLRKVAVDARHLVGMAARTTCPTAPPREPLENLVGAALGAAEDDDLPGILPLQQPLQQVELPQRLDGEIGLLDRLDGEFVDREVEDLGVAHVAGGKFRHRRRHRGGEQQRLPALRAAPQDLLDVGTEPDVEHPVGLVERHDVERRQRQRPAAHVIEHAARRAHDHRRVLGEFVDLSLDRLAAVHGDAVDPRPVRQFLELVPHLDGEFPGRHQHQRPRAAAAAGLVHPLEDGEHERRRLARARTGLAEDVHAGQRPRDEARLHGGGVGVAGSVHRLHRRGREPHRAKCAGRFAGIPAVPVAVPVASIPLVATAVVHRHS